MDNLRLLNCNVNDKIARESNVFFVLFLSTSFKSRSRHFLQQFLSMSIVDDFMFARNCHTCMFFSFAL